jgi:chemotaxis family two-component system response regulator Rcp1
MPVPVHSQGRRAVVLVADESSDFHQLTREALSGARLRVDLRHVETGPDCLALLRREPPHERALAPDLLLLDLNMPRLDGFEVLARIRADDRLRTLPVVVYGSSPSSADVTRMYELGCNTFIRKPPALSALRRDLRRVARYWFELALLAER